MKNILNIFLFVLASQLAYSQSSRLNPDLVRKINSSKTSTEEIHLLVKGNVEELKKELKSVGGTFKYNAGDISSVKIPLSGVKNLLGNKNIERLEYNSAPLEPLMDSVWSQNNSIDSVYNGNSPLTQGYDGSGVIVGFIDTGIDFTHSDFKDSTGSSRILFLWDMLNTLGPAPAPYGYGSEWSKTDINGGVAVMQPVGGSGNSYGGFHGHGVASVAVGDGDTCQSHKSAAPKADIIFVVWGKNLPSTYVEDAAAYIFEKADSLGKPCVINASLGTLFGSHDGNDLRSVFIENLLEAENGRSFVAAAGNAGGFTQHLKYSVTSDTTFTWMKKTGGNPMYLMVYADSVDMMGINFAFGADVQPAYEFRGMTPFENFSSMTLGVNDTSYLKNSSNDTLMQIIRFADSWAGVKSIEYLFFPDSVNYNYRFITTGSGKFDGWCFDPGSALFNARWVVNTTLPDTLTYPDMVRYKMPDTTQSIMSSFQCSEKVISVGTYYNRDCYASFDGTSYCDSTYPQGAYWRGTSRGPTRTGKVKPDITAPGRRLMMSSYTSSIAGIAASGKAVCGIHRFLDNGSTSYSAPAVAGVIACYLQKNPQDNWQEIKDHILFCARQDTFTTSSIPNNSWGWGKLDAFASISNKCGLSVSEIISAKGNFICYPNPFTKQFNISYSLNENENPDKYEIHVIDIFGRSIRNLKLDKGIGSVVVSGEEFSSGIYFCQMKKNNSIIETQEVILVK